MSARENDTHTYMYVENIYLLTKTVFDFDLRDEFTSMLIVNNHKMHNTYIKK